MANGGWIFPKLGWCEEVWKSNNSKIYRWCAIFGGAVSPWEKILPGRCPSYQKTLFYGRQTSPYYESNGISDWLKDEENPFANLSITCIPLWFLILSSLIVFLRDFFFFWWDQSHYLCIFFAAKNSLGFLILPIPSMYGIFTYIYHKNQPNVGKYASPMDPVGYYSTHFWGSLQLFLEKKIPQRLPGIFWSQDGSCHAGAVGEGRCRYCLMCTWMNFECFTVKSFTLQGINISHLGKRKRHMLIPWRVMTLMSTIFKNWYQICYFHVFLSFLLGFSEFLCWIFWFDSVFGYPKEQPKHWIRLQHKIEQPWKQVALNFHQLESP